MVILETPFVQLNFCNQTQVLLIRWLKKPADAVLQEVYTKGLLFLQNHPDLVLYCTDQSLIGSLSRAQEAWLMHEYYPKVYSIIGDSIYAAVVFSDEHFKAIVSNYQVPLAMPHQHFIQFTYFTDIGEAMQWLSDIKKGQDSAIFPS